MLASFVGMVLAIMTDPIVIVSSIALVAMNITIRKQVYIIPIIIIVGILLRIVTNLINAEWHAQVGIPTRWDIEIFLAQILSVAILVYTIVFIYLLFSKFLGNTTKHKVMKIYSGETKTKTNLISSMKKFFGGEEFWRVFIILQIIGVVLLIYTDITTSSWNFFSEDLFKNRYWKAGRENWIALFCIFAPFFITKSISWISSGKKAGNNKG